MSKPLVSIVIPTYNSEKTLPLTLASIKRQTYKNIEVIVVDRGSTDKTVEIARKFTNKVFIIKARERSEQRNFGARMARGKYLYFVDSDFILQPTVVEEAVRKAEEGCDAIVIHNTSNPTVSFWAKVRKLERDTYRDDELNVATRFMRRDVFEKVGGYDEDLVAGEDYDLHNRIIEAGYKVCRINSKEIHIGEPRTLREIVLKHYYYGKTLPKLIAKNKGRAVKQLSPVRPAYLRHWKELARHPTLTIGFIIYQLIRYMAALIGYIISLIWFKSKNK